MPRTRLLKHSFFTNEDLTSLPFETRLLFAGLWGIADREGRIEDRPRRIKVGVFPYDDVDVDQMLWQLHDKRFILRYTYDSKDFISIINFHLHQHPHVNEIKSVLPAPTKDGVSTRQRPSLHQPTRAVIDPVTNTVTNTVTGLREDKEAIKNIASLTGTNGNGHKKAPPARQAKEPPDGRVTAFLKWFQTEYKTRRHGADYFVKWEKDSPLVKKMLGATTPETLQKLAIIMLSEKTTEEFIQNSDRGIGVLSAKFNWLSDRYAKWKEHNGKS